jgi:[ribosomal protein S5]-alanine N-acetyltransferase
MPIALVPLDLSHLAAFEADPSRFAGIPVATGALPPPILLERAARALREGLPGLWHSPFVFVDAALRQVVGSGGFKGFPVAGRVEIGYGVAAGARGRGVATEGVRGLLQAAFAEPDVATVCAETAVDNPASRRVVEKAGFRHVGQRPTDDDGVVDQWERSR